MNSQQPIIRHTFKKAEHLCNRKLIDELFLNGHSFYCYPFKVLWLETTFTTLVPAQLLTAVPKRHMRNAWKRNLMKRHIREAYRQHKESFYTLLQTNQKQCALAIIFTGKKIFTARETEAAIILILRRLTDETSMFEKHKQQ